MYMLPSVMAPQTSSVALLLAVLVAVVIDVSSADIITTQKKTYFSPEAKQMEDRLQEYVTKMYGSYEKFLDNLVQNNDLMTTVKKFRSTYAKGKGTECVGEEPTDESDEGLMMSYINDCQNSMTSVPFKEFITKIKVAKETVEKLDDDLKRNAATCVTDPTGCEATKEEKLKELNSILTDEEAAVFQVKANNALTDCKEMLNSCFQSGIQELRGNLENEILKIDNCMAKHK